MTCTAQQTGRGNMSGDALAVKELQCLLNVKENAMPAPAVMNIQARLISGRAVAAAPEMLESTGLGFRYLRLTDIKSAALRVLRHVDALARRCLTHGFAG